MLGAQSLYLKKARAACSEAGWSGTLAFLLHARLHSQVTGLRIFQLNIDLPQLLLPETVPTETNRSVKKPKKGMIIAVFSY